MLVINERNITVKATIPQNPSFRSECASSPTRNKAKNALSLFNPFSLGLTAQIYEEFGYCKKKSDKRSLLVSLFQVSDYLFQVIQRTNVNRSVTINRDKAIY